MKKIVLFSIIGATAIIACKTTKIAENTKVDSEKVGVPLNCNGTNFSFSTDIKPIMDQYCTSCHGEEGADGLNFNNKSDVVKAANKGELLGTIKWHGGYPQMPPNGDQLDKATIDKIECWIYNGMKD